MGKYVHCVPFLVASRIPPDPQDTLLAQGQLSVPQVLPLKQRPPSLCWCLGFFSPGTDEFRQSWAQYWALGTPPVTDTNHTLCHWSQPLWSASSQSPHCSLILVFWALLELEPSVFSYSCCSFILNTSSKTMASFHYTMSLKNSKSKQSPTQKEEKSTSANKKEAK